MREVHDRGLDARVISDPAEGEAYARAAWGLPSKKKEPKGDLTEN